MSSNKFLEMVKIHEVIDYLEQVAPSQYQEDYDNAGLITGDHLADVKGVLICLDSTEEVIEEALKTDCNLVIAHHPIIFRGLRKLTGSNYVERAIIKAIKGGIAIYAIHTNLDNVIHGVNGKIADKLGLVKRKILDPKPSVYAKLISFVPKENVLEVLDALHDAGAGIIGEYDHCSFRTDGRGRFKPGEKANPYLGEKQIMEEVEEERIEVIFPVHLTNKIMSALDEAHPYEEVAYYIQNTENQSQEIGSGIMGVLEEEMDPEVFLSYLKQKLQLRQVKYTPLKAKKVKKVGICGGAGAFLIKQARKVGLDAFITSDIKYHEFFDSEGKMLLVDVGHYESEVFTKELIYELLNKKFSNIALRLSEVDTNPIRYI